MREFKVGHSAPRFSPDGCRLAACTDGEVRCWDVDSWQPGPSHPRDLEPGQDVNGYVSTPAFSPDGAILAVAQSSTQVELLRASDLSPLVTLQSPDPRMVGEMCFSPDGGQLAVGTDNGAQVWDLRAIRRRLKAMGLDWDKPSLPPSEESAPVTVAVEDSAPAVAVLPVMALPPQNPGRRAATPQQIQDWIQQLGGADAKASAEAAAALLDVGPPAVAPLEQAASGPDAGLARRAAEGHRPNRDRRSLGPTRRPETSRRLDRRSRRRPVQAVRRPRGIRRARPGRRPAEKLDVGAGRRAVLASDRPPLRGRRPDVHCLARSRRASGPRTARPQRNVRRRRPFPFSGD